MKGAKTRSLYVLAALALPLTLPAPVEAQIVIGGTDDDVSVNWAVLDQLGQPPSLPEMLLGSKVRPSPTSVAATRAESAVIYHRAGSKDAAKKAPPVEKITLHPAAGHIAAAKPPATQRAKPAPIPVAATAPRAPEPAPAPTSAKAPTPTPKPTIKPVVVEVMAPPPPPVHMPVAVAEKIVPVQPQPAAPAAAPPKPPQIVVVTAPPPTPAPPVPPALASAPLIAPPVPPSPPAAPPEQIATAVAPPPVSASHGTSVTKGAVLLKGDVLTLVFAIDDSALPDGGQGALTALAQRLSRDESLALQLVAYAQGDDVNTSKARRLSLSRALEVRKVLMDLGVRSTRIEVRALGNKNDGSGAADRVDAIITVH